jgi:hypothetical protein
VFDPNDLRVERGDVPPPPRRARRQSANSLGDFFGPIEGEVFDVAVRLRGKSLAVYLIILRLARMSGANPVTVTTRGLIEYDITRNEKAKALEYLEKAGLIRQETHHGKNPLVHVLIDQVQLKPQRRKR